MNTKLTAKEVAATILNIALEQGIRKGIDAQYLQTNHFPEISLGTIRRACNEAYDLNLITNDAYRDNQRHWIPSRHGLLEEIRSLRNR